jgi:hypothetical protein
VACAAGDAAATGSGKAAALDLQGEPTGESFRNGAWLLACTPQDCAQLNTGAASAGQDDDEEACAAELSMTTGLGCNLKGIDSLLAADICGKSDGIGEDGGRTEAEASMATDEVVVSACALCGGTTNESDEAARAASVGADAGIGTVGDGEDENDKEPGSNNCAAAALMATGVLRCGSRGSDKVGVGDVSTCARHSHGGPRSEEACDSRILWIADAAQLLPGAASSLSSSSCERVSARPRS